MALSDVKRRSKSAKRKQYAARKTNPGRREFNVKVAVQRQGTMLTGGPYVATACFTRRAARPPAKEGLMIWPRCGQGHGKTPSQAVRNSLRDFTKKLKPEHNKYRREWRSRF